MSTSIIHDMATAASQQSASHGVSSGSDLLVCLPPMTAEAQTQAGIAIADAFPSSALLVAACEPRAQDKDAADVSWIEYDSARGQTGWALHAADYVAAGNLARKHQKQNVILLGSEAPSAAMLTSLAQALASGTDVAMPKLHARPTDGLVNSGLLYPLTRALFGHDVRYPLPHNIGLSQRAMERLAAEAQREISAGRSESLLWPVSIAAAAGFSIRQVESDEHLPSPSGVDFNRLFTEVVGSLLADTEARAILWQRGRYVAPAQHAAPPVPVSQDVGADVASMVEGFRVAYANLLPLWSLVVPPQSLLALKKLAPTSPQDFTLPPELWARIVYDFALAFHLRTINRNHLLGALTPLYLAWAASHIRSASGEGADAERLVCETAAAFEAEKPYFVSRWRWPDRFNP